MGVLFQSISENDIWDNSIYEKKMQVGNELGKAYGQCLKADLMASYGKKLLNWK